MSELTELLQWALARVEEVLAHLGLILLLECVELTLVAIEVVVVGLLGQVSEDLAWRVVEVSWTALGVDTLALILGLWLAVGGARVVGRLGALWGSILVFLWSLLLRSHWLSWFLVATNVLEVRVVWHFSVYNL